VITEDERPYLALGADLSANEQHTVLELMGIEASNLEQYDVVYVSNDEEHKYLDAYVPKEKIGTRALSSVLIVGDEEGSGLKVSIFNINYCTAGMYKNALATAGVTDAKVIVAGPFAISGTAALVGTLEAYEKMTGETLDEQVVDAAMDELVTTGELEQSIDGDAEDVEAMIADLKAKIANGELDTKEQIASAIDELAEEYDLKLTEEDKEQLLSLLEKLKDLDLDWDAIADQASAWADELQTVIDSKGVGSAISNFFTKLWEAIKSFFGW
jgi:uncharacterized protein YpuA (DUF1002 family)